MNSRIQRLIAGVVCLAAAGCSPSSDPGEVIVYCAQDQVYAEPVFREFTRRTGVEVRAVFDSEAVKTVGIAQRLLAERPAPVADVFWGNEELRTRQLSARDVFDPGHGWRVLGYRSRCLVVNTQRISMAALPASLSALARPEWRGRVAVANPLFGSTSTHFHLLRQRWGDSNWTAWCQALLANQTRVTEGNSQVVQAVARGQADIGLTDTDDVLAAQREGAPVARGPWMQDMPVLANTVAVIRGHPHPSATLRFIEFMSQTWVHETLVSAGALERSDTPWGAAQETPWEPLLRDLEDTTRLLRTWFNR